jgi:tRNA 2-thiocytidine biosynthesis protein TtcA
VIDTVEAELSTEEKLELKKLTKKLRGTTYQAIEDYKQIVEGDKVMVCLSGGKDSYTMLDCLIHIQKGAKYNFEIIAVNLDQKQPGFPEEVLPKYLTELGVPFQIVEKDTYSIVKEKIPEGKTTCSLCSRLRRGTLYQTAKELGVTKIALGHHRDDIVETLFLNLFFNGIMETMPCKFRTDSGEHVVIRPLAYCKEKDIARFAKLMKYPIIPCNLCGSQPKLQRQVVKKMLTEWEVEYPGRSESIFSAMKKVAPSHLYDRDLFDFENLPGKSDISLDDVF